MYFISYTLKGGAPESGILSKDGKFVLPLLKAGELIGEKLPSTLLAFIQMQNPDLVSSLRTSLEIFPDEQSVPVDQVKILSPIPDPVSDVLGVAKNYIPGISKRREDENVNAPIWFSKRKESVTAPQSPVNVWPEYTKKVAYEAEMAVVIGKDGINIKEEDAEEYVFGYMCVNDLTARDLWQDGQIFLSKSFDTFCPLGPVLLVKSSLHYPPELNIRMEVNGEVVQKGNTRDLIYGVSRLIADFSRGRALHAGDIILSGTPAGKGCALEPPKFVKKGDVMAVTVEHLGTLVNPVV